MLPANAPVACQVPAPDALAHLPEPPCSAQDPSVLLPFQVKCFQFADPAVDQQVSVYDS